MALWRERPTCSSSPQAFRMRVTVSSAKSLHLAKGTNKKIRGTATVRGALAGALFLCPAFCHRRADMLGSDRTRRNIASRNPPTRLRRKEVIGPSCAESLVLYQSELLE